MLGCVCVRMCRVYSCNIVFLRVLLIKGVSHGTVESDQRVWLYSSLMTATLRTLLNVLNKDQANEIKKNKKKPSTTSNFQLNACCVGGSSQAFVISFV